MQEPISECWERYFKSKGAGYAYVLLHTDGKTRTNLLGINRQHYVNSNAAAAWKQEIESALDAITEEIPQASVVAAKAVLYTIYSNMIGSIGGENNKELYSSMRDMASEMFTKARSLMFEHVLNGFKEEMNKLLPDNMKDD